MKLTMRRRVFIALLLAALVVTPQLQAEPGLYSPNTYQGETFSRVLTWQDSTDALVSLVGYSAKLQIKNSSGGLILELTDSSGLTLGGTDGTITWAMTAAQTLALPIGSYAYDLRMTSGTSVVTYLLYGYVTVHETRTR